VQIDTSVPAAHHRDLSSSYPRILEQLRSWPGYALLARVLDQFDDLRVFLAGGAVRNWLSSGAGPTRDLDLFLGGASVEAALRVLLRHGQCSQTPYGAPRWYPAGSDQQYADLIPIAEFKPGLWRCEDMVDVLNQFDVTVNAIAFDVRSGDSLDPQNGYRDLSRRVIRLVRFDYPDEPFVPGAPLTRNAILWFRALHYASALDFTIEPLTLEWLRAHRRYERDAEAFGGLFFRPHPGYLEPLSR